MSLLYILFNIIAAFIFAENPLIGVVTAVMFVVIGLLFLLPYAITTFKLYQKAGQPGWAIFVPVYDSMVMARAGGRAAWAGVVTGILYVLWIISGTSILAGIVTLPAIGFFLYLLYGFVKSFDRGLLFWVGYIFLPLATVFFVDKATYTRGDGGAVTGVAGMPQQPPMAQPYGGMTPQQPQPFAPQQPVQSQPAQPQSYPGVPQQQPVAPAYPSQQQPTQAPQQPYNPNQPQQ